MGGKPQPIQAKAPAATSFPQFRQYCLVGGGGASSTAGFTSTAGVVGIITGVGCAGVSGIGIDSIIGVLAAVIAFSVFVPHSGQKRASFCKPVPQLAQ